MPSNRDLVRFEPDERVDLPDFVAVQRMGRGDNRSQLLHLVFDADAQRVLSGWAVAAAGVPDATVTVTAGSALGAELLDDGSYEYGVAYGREGDASQIVDLTGKPVGTYGIWIRFVNTPASAGNRVFWDANIDAEVVSPIDTRYEAGWDAVAALVSPGTDYQSVASVVWGGATVVAGNITAARNLFFEGDQATAYAHEWGGGANDRNADRGLYGVGSLHKFVHAVRRQLEEIMDGGQKWYAMPAYSLADAQTHAADSTDPHGANLTLSGRLTLSDNDVGIIDTPSAGQRHVNFDFSDFRFNRNATNGNLIEWGPSDTDTRYVYYNAANASAPDIVLSISPMIVGLRSNDEMTIDSIIIYWNQQTVAAAANAGNCFTWAFERRTAGSTAAWTVAASGTVSGGSEYAAGSPDSSTLAVAYTHSAISGFEQEYRLTLNLQGTVDGDSPFIHGGRVLYTPTVINV